MGLNDLPEVKLARLIRKKHSLTVPFDLDNLVEKYASLIHKSIPISGVDGVCINLKVLGKKPKIILNTDLPPRRQLFTLAHEFGHLIIPWHTGTIVDNLNSQSLKDFLYNIIEQEANRFAAELLMPIDWVLNEYKLCENIAHLQKKIAETIGVSDQASAIRIVHLLPPEIIYIAEENGIVIHSGKTDGTNANLPENNSFFNPNLYPYKSSYSINSINEKKYHWFDLKSTLIVNTEDTRTWKEILHDMTVDIKPIEGVDQFKKSINGKLSYAHGSVKIRGNYNIDNVITACLYRLRDSVRRDFVEHKDFEKFIKLRAQSFFK